MDNQRILIDAGLSEEQALIYDALLERGPQKASALSKWTGIKRSTVYKNLEQLNTLGLVSQRGGKGTVAIFSPNHPSILLSSFEQKEKELSMAKNLFSDALSSLSSRFNLQSGKPNVQFFEGEDAIQKITGDYPKTDKDIRQWIDISISMKEIKEEFLVYIEKRKEKGISKKMIVPDNTESRDYAKHGSDITEFRIDKNIKSLPTAIQVYDDKVAMLTLNENKKIGVIIEDSEIAETMKYIFDSMWKILPPPGKE